MIEFGLTGKGAATMTAAVTSGTKWLEPWTAKSPARRLKGVAGVSSDDRTSRSRLRDVNQGVVDVARVPKALTSRRK